MMDCPHHKHNCPVVICGRVPYPCEEKATWYVTFSERDTMARCDEHVAAAMSWSTRNTVYKIPRVDHGE